MAPLKKDLILDFEALKNWVLQKINKEADACGKAKFMEDWSRAQVEGIYWGMVIFIMLLVVTASLLYSRTERECR